MFLSFAAINYDEQAMAHIGLVGAYAVPFLLSESSGNVAILFTYMAIINVGILIVAFRKYWKPLYYSSFVLTWIIFATWNFSDYQVDQHFRLALIFLLIFFTTFYAIFLGYKLSKREEFNIGDIILLLANSFVFYGLGYTILGTHEEGTRWLGVFTLSNAIVHLVISAIIFQKKSADRSLFYLVFGLVLVFITVAIPVQLNGNWVSLLWALEGVLLFWIGRTRNVSFYELLSYPLMVLAFMSIIQDWSIVYQNYNPDEPSTLIIPILNVHFLTSAFVVGCFAFINVLNHNSKYPTPDSVAKRWSMFSSFVLPSLLLFLLFFSIEMEIASYWDQRYADATSADQMQGSTHNLKAFKIIWIINWSYAKLVN